MKYKYTRWIVLVTIISLYFFLSVRFSETKSYFFNAKPAACGEISNSLSLISKEKLETIYATKIIIYREYSPDKHLETHPRDVAIRTNTGDDSNIVVILTNENPHKDSYFVSKNVAIAKR